MPHLIRFLIDRFAEGVVLGLSVGLAILWSDLGKLARLFAASRHEATLTAFFLAETGILFGTFAMCVAVMNLSDDG